MHELKSRNHKMIKEIFRNLNRFIVGLALIGFSGMLISTWAQVLFRKLAISVDWTEELARILFVLSVFLGIAIAVAEKRHIIVDFIFNKLPMRGRALVGIIFDLIILVFLIFLLRGAAIMVSVTWESFMIAISWLRTGYLYLVECIAIVLTMVYILVDFGENWGVLLSPDDAPEENNSP